MNPDAAPCTFKLTIAYDGTNYAGWQFQPDEVTIQSVLEDAIRQVTSQSVRVVASGRTDAGVHALGQVVSARIATTLDEETLCRALNATTPHDVTVHQLARVRDDFHAIRDARGKRYRYLIQDGRFANPLLLQHAWFVHHVLNVDAMDEAAQRLMGTHDFRSFEASGAERKTSVRTITDIFARREPDDRFPRITIEVAADGFLYNMVRNIVGALVDVGKGVREPSWIDELVAAQDRRLGSATAPPQGLVLVRVDYNE